MARFRVVQSGGRSPDVAPAPPPPSPSDIPLPTWTDFSSVLSYITSVVAVIVGLIAALEPGFQEPAAVQAALPAVALVVATVAQIYNAITHRAALASVAVAAIGQGGQLRKVSWSPQ